MSHRTRWALAAFLLLSALPAVRAHAAEDCRLPEGPALEALRRAHTQVSARDLAGARATLAALEKLAHVDGAIRLQAAGLLSRAGRPEAARALLQTLIAEAKASAPDQLQKAAALIRLGQIDAGEALAARLPATGLDTICGHVQVAMALADAGALDKAAAALRALRDKAGTVRSIHDGLVEVLFRKGDSPELEAALRAAVRAFPDDPAFHVRLANRMKVAGKVDAARDLLEGLILRGAADPSLLGEFLGMVSGGARAAKLLPHYTQLAEAHPELPVLRMVVGILHHYEGHFAESNAHLARTGALQDREPRIPMYMAMNYFRLHDQDKAEAFIAKASAIATRPDPDIFYCRAVIGVRKDPARSMADLERYMDVTTGRPDVNPSKQKRVKQTVALLKSCLAEADPRACVEREVVEKARALAFEEHQAAFRPPGQAAPDAGPGPDRARGSSTETAPARAAPEATPASRPDAPDRGLLWIVLAGATLLLAGGLWLRGRRG